MHSRRIAARLDDLARRLGISGSDYDELKMLVRDAAREGLEQRHTPVLEEAGRLHLPVRLAAQAPTLLLRRSPGDASSRSTSPTSSLATDDASSRPTSPTSSPATEDASSRPTHPTVLAPFRPGAGTIRAADAGRAPDLEALEAESPRDFVPRLARYEVAGLLGSGGMGDVHTVRDPDLNRTVALKVLHADFLQIEEATIRFVEEAQVNAQLQHPGIVPVHELGRLPDGRLYFTMREVKGRTLEAVIQEVHGASRGGSWQAGPSGWTFRRLIDTFLRVCETMAYAHSRGVVHRDIKPSNVMVGEYGETLVLDWGLAKLVGRAEACSGRNGAGPLVTARSESGIHATQMGRVTGTPAYMSPEQALGEVQRVSPASDVYALGAVLYEILAGRPPFDHEQVLVLLHQVLHGEIQPPGRAVPEGTVDRPEEAPGSRRGALPVPAALQEICLKALSRRPEDRYPDAGQLAAEVSAWLEGARKREQALAVVAQAEALQPEIAQLRARAAALRDEAARILSGIKSFEPVERKLPGWELEDEAAGLERLAEVKQVEFVNLLQGALTFEPQLPEARELLASHYRALHFEAEARRETAAAVRYEGLLRAHRTPRHRAYLEGYGAITLMTDPAGAEVLLYQYTLQQRRLVPTFLRVLGRTPLRAVALPRGSYLLLLRAAGRIDVRYPVAIGREDHWNGIRPGDVAPYPIYLPREGELTDDECYVPAGRYPCGGDPHTPHPLPHRRLWVDGFVMRRFPITNREYIAFLDDLVDRGRELEALRALPRQKVVGDQEGAPVYGRDRRGHFTLEPDHEGDIWQADWPVMLANWRQASAYCRWQRERTGQPWRLPSELEWEKAARGTDGRFFPWGDFLDPTWCLVRESHAGTHLPAVVDSYPVDESPYLVRGMAGGVVDWCRDVYQPGGPPVDGELAIIDERDPEPGDPTWELPRVVRGGAWSFFYNSARATRRQGFIPTLQDYSVGFRLARTFPHR